MFFGQELQGGRGFRHLHEGEDTFLHACAAGTADDDHGPFVSDGAFYAAGDFLAHDRSHTAAEEEEIEHAQFYFVVAHFSRATYNGVGTTSRFECRFDTVLVFLFIFEFDRIGRGQVMIVLLERIGIDQ